MTPNFFVIIRCIKRKSKAEWISLPERKERPAACGMDICVTAEGRTLRVEVNDAYALGCYGLNSVKYAKMISARWCQLLGVQDGFKVWIQAIPWGFMKERNLRGKCNDFKEKFKRKVRWF